MLHTRLLTFALCLFATALTACDGAVKNFVKDTQPPSTGREPQSTPQGPQQLSPSGGSIDATANGLRMKARINTTERAFTMGPDRRATVSIGRTRVN